MLVSEQTNKGSDRTDRRKAHLLRERVLRRPGRGRTRRLIPGPPATALGSSSSGASGQNPRACASEHATQCLYTWGDDADRRQQWKARRGAARKRTGVRLSIPWCCRPWPRCAAPANYTQGPAELASRGARGRRRNSVRLRTCARELLVVSEGQGRRESRERAEGMASAQRSRYMASESYPSVPNHYINFGFLDTPLFNVLRHNNIRV
jgi:hypothetical protein